MLEVCGGGLCEVCGCGLCEVLRCVEVDCVRCVEVDCVRCVHTSQLQHVLLRGACSVKCGVYPLQIFPCRPTTAAHTG